MFWRKRHERIANSIADPLVRRVYIRSQRERRRREASDALWDLSWSPGTLDGRAFVAVPFYFLFGFVWAVVCATIEEVRLAWLALRDWRRKRRYERYVRHARTSRRTTNGTSRAA